MKIAINSCYGGFSLSKEATEKLASWGHEGAAEHLLHCKDRPRYFYYRDVKRDDPLLIRVVEEMGEAANGSCAEIKIVEIPDGIIWEIAEYDGCEHVAEQHRTWG